MKLSVEKREKELQKTANTHEKNVAAFKLH